MESQVFSVAASSPDIRGFPCEHEVDDVLVFIDGAKCSSELEGKEVDYVRDPGVVEFLSWSAEEFGPLEWESGGELFSTFLAGAVS